MKLHGVQSQQKLCPLCHHCKQEEERYWFKLNLIQSLEKLNKSSVLKQEVQMNVQHVYKNGMLMDLLMMDIQVAYFPIILQFYKFSQFDYFLSYYVILI
ncbi:unnamed protein product [Paramecium octaurelia]|uniref:Uncharacterized protein n=1 Tax=Paramecium octaurelia TaxID=43137 RepID=A0A8S1YCJ6_PAROT|nr:unnamed protein product [Paramecium octaurelia]